MSEIKNVLVTVQASTDNMKKLKEVLAPAKVTICTPSDREIIAQTAQTADVCILKSDLDDDILAGKNIKCIHCCHAGVEKSARPELFERGIILTTSSGRSASALAEHSLMFMLALTYDIPMLLRAQKRHVWVASPQYAQKTGLYGKTVGILGVGKTGLEVARLCKGFNMRVLGWRRGTDVPENVDEIFSSDRGDNLHLLLKQVDYLVLCIELNDNTWHMISEEELSAMKPTAYLINMGRGRLIDEKALIAALQKRVIAGAGLDTVEQEPLPPNSPLWDLPNVIITPHTTPQLPDREDRMMSYVFKNIQAYRENKDFVNRVTERSILTKGRGKPQ